MTERKTKAEAKGKAQPALTPGSYTLGKVVQTHPGEITLGDVVIACDPETRLDSCDIDVKALQFEGYAPRVGVGYTVSEILKGLVERVGTMARRGAVAPLGDVVPRAEFSVRTLAKLARALAVDLDDLVRDPTELTAE